jgi:hypothetical protein
MAMTPHRFNGRSRQQHFESVYEIDHYQTTTSRLARDGLSLPVGRTGGWKF